MTLDGINGMQGSNPVLKTDSTQRKTSHDKEWEPIEHKPGLAKKKITKQDTEQALNEPQTSKAVKNLLEKSPVGLGNQQTKEEITNLGYTFVGTAYHPGAPVIYNSSDGGTIKVYPGNGFANTGEDVRKTVYENGNYKQEMIYNENGTLTKFEITIKDDYGHREPNGRITVLCNEEGNPKSYIR